ncbi:ester cyclase [Phycobacter sp. K97]|uniref:ester cyclase n=1 Tax=Phycobacter sedimenti TaxID=3133977 RepID=UPI00311E8125
MRDFLNAAFGGASPGKIERFIVEGATYRGAVTSGEELPITEWAELAHVVRGLIGRTVFRVENKVEERDWISLRIHITATCLATGKEIETYDCLMVRFEGDKIAEYIGHMDYISFFEQLELVPSGALHACLSGQRLVWE